MNNSQGFASDNNSGIHPDVLQAIIGANKGHCGGYGDDPYTAEALKTFKAVFGEHVVVFFVCMVRVPMCSACVQLLSHTMQSSVLSLLIFTPMSVAHLKTMQAAR